MGCGCVYIYYGRSRHLLKDKDVTAKVIIDNKKNEVKIIIGKFDDEESMIAAAYMFCEALNIDYIPDMPVYMDEEETVH